MSFQQHTIKHLSPLGGAGGGSRSPLDGDGGSDSILAAITYYCRYQERSHKEVKNKLYELGCTTPEVDEYLIKVMEAGFLNEERFARAIARGKFRLKHWGRNKIIQQLKQQQVSEFCIKKALTEIDEDEYLATAKKLAEKKLKELKSEKNIFIRKQKMYRYLLQKGYESSVINFAVNETLKQ